MKINKEKLVKTGVIAQFVLCAIINGLFAHYSHFNETINLLRICLALPMFAASTLFLVAWIFEFFHEEEER